MNASWDCMHSHDELNEGTDQTTLLVAQSVDQLYSFAISWELPLVGHNILWLINSRHKCYCCTDCVYYCLSRIIAVHLQYGLIRCDWDLAIFSQHRLHLSRWHCFNSFCNGLQEINLFIRRLMVHLRKVRGQDLDLIWGIYMSHLSQHVSVWLSWMHTSGITG